MEYPYLYDKQFEKCINQFMRVFSCFQVQDGVEREGQYRTERVPIVYGAMDRVVAGVLQRKGKLQNSRIPLMSANLTNIQIDTERKRSKHHKDHITVKRPQDDSPRGIERLVGPALILNMELSIYASSTTELFSILEQILLIFNPRVAIQVDNQLLNSDYITEISLESMDSQISFPLGTDKQVVMFSLSFLVPVRLRYPMDIDAGFAEEIILSIIDQSSEGIEVPLEQVIIQGNQQEEMDNGDEENNDD